MVHISLTKQLAIVVILASKLITAAPTQSSSTPEPKWSKNDRIVVSIDVPDADNFPMAAYAILSNPDIKVAIILAGRKIDFGWLNWHNFNVLRRKRK